MSSAYWISLIAIAEFALLMAVLVAVIVGVVMRRRRRENSAANDLAARVSGQIPQRLDDLRASLGKAFGLTGADLQKQADKLVALENEFYDQLIRAWLTRDSKVLSQMDDQLRAVVTPYLDMRAAAPQPGQASAPAAESTAGGAPGNDAARLKALLNKANDDIMLYRETLNRVFSEYTAMFGVHLDPNQQLTAHEILERLKSGQLVGDEAAPAAAEENGEEAPGLPPARQ